MNTPHYTFPEGCELQSTDMVQTLNKTDVGADFQLASLPASIEEAIVEFHEPKEPTNFTSALADIHGQYTDWESQEVPPDSLWAEWFTPPPTEAPPPPPAA